MRRVLIVFFFLTLPVFAQIRPGHRLPEGPYQAVREREIDIQTYRASLRFDMDKEEISGTAWITFTPLRTGLQEFSLDAADLEVKSVTSSNPSRAHSFEIQSKKLRVRLSAPLDPGQTETVSVSYSCRPKTGMYFFPRTPTRAAQAWNYGEGGLHSAWLPIYSDVNDRFGVEFEITVARPYVVVSNGRLVETKENSDGTRTFHWKQEQPIPNYLITVDVGELARVPIGEAAVDSVKIPLAAWTPPGTEKHAAYSFKDTPKMVEFFSQKLGYPYPWSKYDQVALREFAIGAMETTTATGFSESHLHLPDDPPDSGPSYTQPHPTWTYEDTIAHELAHHWFGDLVTCSSLASIWLNESFATFLHTVWTGHAHGEDDLTYQRWHYLNNYLEHVNTTGSVRPLEYFKYTAPDEMYESATTYVKGSLVLHMLRHFVGDTDFFRTLSDYLRTYQYQNVESENLKKAFEKTTGKNLSWFFNDWVTGGGGHPVFDLSYRWAPERRQVDLTVRQIQADLPFENDFRLPVEIEIFTASGAAARHWVQIEGWTTRVSLPAESKPLAVNFDKGGWLICEVSFPRPLEEISYLLANGDLAARLRAARQLASEFPRRPETIAALAGVLKDSKAHWGLRQEAAVSLGMAGGDAATGALTGASADPDRRVRRAVAIALGDAAGSDASATLQKMIGTDRAEDVVGAAAISLGRIHAAGARDFLVQQLSRDSRYWNSIRLGALLGLSQLRDATLVSTFIPYTDSKWEIDIRTAALTAWMRADGAHPQLPETLRRLCSDRNRQMRQTAIGLLGSLHRADDIDFLKGIADSDPDPDISSQARGAAEEIESFVNKKG